MKRLTTIMMGLALIAVGGLAAQQPGRAVLQQRVLERFVQNFSSRAALTDEQATQFRTTWERTMRLERDAEQRRRALLRGMESELRPGVAANSDRLVAMMDSLEAVRREQITISLESFEEYATYLNPIQRAQLLLEMERFQRMISNVGERAQQNGRGPG